MIAVFHCVFIKLLTVSFFRNSLPVNFTALIFYSFYEICMYCKYFVLGTYRYIFCAYLNVLLYIFAYSAHILCILYIF